MKLTHSTSTRLITMIALLIAMSLNVSAQGMPGAIGYQGQLLDSAGDPVTTEVTIIFTLWDSATTGTQLGSAWSDDDTVTPDADGVYSTEIGDDPGNPVPSDVFDAVAVWLNVNVGGEDLTPRSPLLSVPYAFKADTATTADTTTSAQRVKQIVRDFVVASGQSVTAGDVVTFFNGEVGLFDRTGDELVFNAASTLSTSVVALSSNKFVVAYNDDGNSGHGTAIIGDITGNTVTFGSEVVFNAAVTFDISVTKLLSSKFVVAYSDDGNFSHGTAIIGEVSGNTITFGSETVFNAANTSFISVTALFSDQFVVAYTDFGNSSRGTAIVGDIAGNSITYGSETVYNFGITFFVSVTALSSDQFVVAYQDRGNNLRGTAIIGQVSSNTITFGSETIFNPGSSAAFMSMAALSSDQFVVAYGDAGNSVFGTAIIGDVSGNTITYGSEVVFNPATDNSISVTALSSNQIVIAYRDEGNSNFGTMIVGEVSGNTITFDSENVFNTADTQFNSVTALSSDQFVMAYQDLGNSNHGTVVVMGGEPLGIAGADANAGQSVPVILDGVSDIHTGLTPWTNYYAGDNGALTTNDGDALWGTKPKVGKALSPTELLLKID